MYKVTYEMLAIMDDGSKGNISQGSGVAYMEAGIAAIPVLLNNYLANKKRVAVISNIQKIKGYCIIEYTK